MIHILVHLLDVLREVAEDVVEVVLLHAVLMICSSYMCHDCSLANVNRGLRYYMAHVAMGWLELTK